MFKCCTFVVTSTQNHWIIHLFNITKILNKFKIWGLATLLEGAGLLFIIFECEFQTYKKFIIKIILILFNDFDLMLPTKKKNYSITLRLLAKNPLLH